MKLQNCGYWFQTQKDNIDWVYFRKNICSENDLEFFWAGTQHFIFEIGWMWIIPLDENLISIGVVVDTNFYIENSETFLKFIFEKYPKNRFNI